MGVLRDQGIFTYFDEVPSVEIHGQRIPLKQINQLFFWELERVNSKPLPSAKWPVHPCVSDLGELPKLQEQWAAEVWSGEVSEIVPVSPTGGIEV